MRTEKIARLEGRELSGIQLDSGEILPADGLFVALGVAGSTALARKIGAAVEGNRILTDERMMTTVPGLFAAGDCTGGLPQVAKAVYEGRWRVRKPQNAEEVSSDAGYKTALPCRPGCLACGFPFWSSLRQTSRTLCAARPGRCSTL